MNWKFTDNFGTGFKLWHWLRHAGQHPCFDGEFDLLVNWDESDTPRQVRGAINGALRSVKKDVVDDVARQAFGYSTFIDPEKHRGWAVEKTTEQGTHTGRVVLCPMKYNWHEHTDKHGNVQRRIYQRLVDNRTFPMGKPLHEQGEQLVREYHVSVMLGEVAAVFVTDKAVVNTFAPHVPSRIYTHLLERNTDELTRPELKQVLMFARKLGVDIGEVDLVRDNGTGRLYVIDAEARPRAEHLLTLSEAAQNDAKQRHAELILARSKFYTI